MSENTVNNAVKNLGHAYKSELCQLMKTVLTRQPQTIENHRHMQSRKTMFLSHFSSWFSTVLSKDYAWQLNLLLEHSAVVQMPIRWLYTAWNGFDYAAAAITGMPRYTQHHRCRLDCIALMTTAALSCFIASVSHGVTWQHHSDNAWPELHQALQSQETSVTYKHINWVIIIITIIRNY